MIEPREDDILCSPVGRLGEQRKKNRGMTKFRDLLRRNSEKFAQCKSSGEEKFLVGSIVASVKSNGGRFLKRSKETKHWSILDENKALQWTIQRFDEESAGTSSHERRSMAQSPALLASPIPAKIPRKSGHSDEPSVGNGGRSTSMASSAGCVDRGSNGPAKSQQNDQQRGGGRISSNQFHSLVRTASGSNRSSVPLCPPFSPKHREEMDHRRKSPAWSPPSSAKGSSAPKGSSSRRSMSSSTSLPRKRSVPASIVDQIPQIPDITEGSSGLAGRSGDKRILPFPSSIGWKQGALPVTTASKVPSTRAPVVSRDDKKAAASTARDPKRWRKSNAPRNAVTTAPYVAGANTGRSAAASASNQKSSSVRISSVSASVLRSDGKSTFGAASADKGGPQHSEKSRQKLNKRKPANVQSAQARKKLLGSGGGRVNQYAVLMKEAELARPCSSAGFGTQKGGRWKNVKRRSLSVSENGATGRGDKSDGNHVVDNDGSPAHIDAPVVSHSSPRDGTKLMNAKRTPEFSSVHCLSDTETLAGKECSERTSANNASCRQEETIPSTSNEAPREENDSSTTRNRDAASLMVDELLEPGGAGKMNEGQDRESSVDRENKGDLAPKEHSPRKRHKQSSTSAPDVSNGQDAGPEMSMAENDTSDPPLDDHGICQERSIVSPKISNEKQNSIVTTIVGIDGIVLVCPQQQKGSVLSSPLLPPWPARIANSLESEECLQEYWEAGMNISRRLYVCVYIYFPPPALPQNENVDGSASASSRNNGPESHREFVHLSRLRPFVEAESSKVFRSCAFSRIPNASGDGLGPKLIKDVKGQFRCSWNVAAGLRRWALGSEMHKRGAKDQRQGDTSLNASPHERAGNYGVVFAVPKNDWKVAALASPDEVISLILANEFVLRFTTHDSRQSRTRRDARNEKLIRLWQHFKGDDNRDIRDNASATEPLAENSNTVDDTNNNRSDAQAVAEECRPSKEPNSGHVSSATVTKKPHEGRSDTSSQMGGGQASASSEQQFEEAPDSSNLNDLSLRTESSGSRAKTGNVPANGCVKESSFASILQMMDDDESDQPTGQTSNVSNMKPRALSSRGKIDEQEKKTKDGSSELDSVVGADGIVLVSGRDRSRSIHRPWPARVVCARESDERRLKFKRDGKPVDPNKVCIFYFFPCWGGVDGAAMQSPAPAKDRWYHLDFVDPDRLNPFVDDDAFDLNGVPDDIVERFKRGWTVAAGLKFWSLGAEFSKRHSYKCKLKGSNEIHFHVQDYGPVLTISDAAWIEESASHDPDSVVQMINSSLKSSNYKYDERQSKELRDNLGMNFAKLCRVEENVSESRPPTVGGASVGGEKVSAQENHRPARAHDLFHVLDEGRRPGGAMTNGGGGGSTVKQEQSGTSTSISNAAVGSSLWGELFTISSLGAKFARSSRCAESRAIFEDLDRVDPDKSLEENDLTTKIRRACKRILDVEEENARLKSEVERLNRSS